MSRTYIRAKLHGLRITECNVDYHGSITLDPEWMEQAGIDPYEQVHVLDCDTGARLITYTIPGTPGGREVGVNGAAARLVAVRDKILVLSYHQAEAFAGAKVLMFDEKNEVSEQIDYVGKNLDRVNSKPKRKSK